MTESFTYEFTCCSITGCEWCVFTGPMYDPVMSSFLSVDNYVQSPENSQNFNRYAYCLNNPLKYNDPSGNVAVVDDIIIGAIIGGIMNYSFQCWSGNINNSGDAIAAFGIGSASGAIGAWVGGADLQSGDVWGGYCRFFLNGKSELHVSSYAIRANAVTFQSIAGHELIHAHHHYAIPNYISVESEKVAYRYSYDVYMRNGMWRKGVGKMCTAMNNNCWGEALPEYVIPYVYRFGH